MNRFLKKEWENFEIPETVQVRARQAAWSKLQQPGKGIGWVWPAAGLAAASALLLLWIVWPGEAPQFVVEPELAELPMRLPDGAGGRLVMTASLSHEPTRGAPRLTPGAVIAEKPIERPERVVLQFQLPKSGVQMIWIKDENFTFGGE